MAARFIGINKDETVATVSAMTTGKQMELVIDDTLLRKKNDVYIALERIQDALIEDTGYGNI